MRKNVVIALIAAMSVLSVSGCSPEQMEALSNMAAQSTNAEEEAKDTSTEVNEEANEEDAEATEEAEEITEADKAEEDAGEEAEAVSEKPKKSEKKQEVQPSEVQPDGGKVEVGRVYMEDCGMDTGYWMVTYSDGSVEYIDE